MRTLRFRCRRCKKVQPHTTSEEFGALPEGMVLVECQVCEVVGIENTENEVKSVAKALKDELGKPNA
ncbi:Zinc finger, DNL-type [uncultured Caudovirales phage]|uniref:Zinc finger, DNL-type n=1 Tax=uncultured Caudovirales phage TaxID=2100421 RepID=A0A6J5NQV4_9CAUD|nr:Zinc finger, DNL-type [uncultured Caudovirales phage]